MNQDKKRVLTTLTIVAILLSVFAVGDLAISQAIFNPDSAICVVFEVLGELPASITAVFCAMFLLLNQNNEVIWKRILAKMGYALIIFIGASMGCMLSLSYIELLSPISFIIGMAAYILGAYFIAIRVPLESRQKCCKIAVVGLFLFLFSMVTFNLIKMSWGRMRFCFMDDPAVQFSPWFLRQGFTTDNTFMSFPSGHGAQSSFILMITLLPLAFESLKNKGKILTAISYAWIITICISRVVLGRHFASDVTMGFLVTFVYFELLRHFYLNKALEKLDK